MKKETLISLATIAALAIFTGTVQSQMHDEEAVKAWGEGVKSDVIAGLVAGRTWHLNWLSCMGSSDCSTYWDFADDGTLCARGIGATPKDQCADDGKWQIKDNSLCWELTWLGGGDGYKSTCVLIKETGSDKFEATRARGLGLPFFEFKLIDQG